MSLRTLSAPVTQEFCGTTHAAQLLGLSVATVQALVEKGVIQAWKTRGGHRRISLSSINQYLQQHSPQGEVAAPEVQRLQVLVVEDDPDAREIYRWNFDQWKLPLDCLVRASALEALVDITRLRPHLLITDLNMPGVDGVEMLKVLRRNEQLAGLQVLVVSGMPREAIADPDGVLRGTLLMGKPVNFDWLHGYISALISARGVGSAPVPAPVAAHAWGEAHAS